MRLRRSSPNRRKLDPANASDHLPEGATAKLIHWVQTPWVRVRCIVSLGLVMIPNQQFSWQRTFMGLPMKEVTLNITLHGFCIERALWKTAISDGVTFRQFISDDNGFISADKLAQCLNPVMDFASINADTTPFDESYLNADSHPKAEIVSVANIRESSEEESIYCDATWTFERFKITSKDEAMESFSTTEEELGTYMLQMHSEILRSYGLRNNRRSEPLIKIQITE